MEDVRYFEYYLESLGGFKDCWDNGYAKHKAKFMIQGDDRNQRPVQTRNARQVPEWQGVDFEQWKKEIEGWSRGVYTTEEEKYNDILNTLKKNSKVKEFVVNTLMMKVGDTKTVDRLLEVMSEKYERNVGEKTMEVMKKICGEGFRMDKNIEDVLENFERMMVQIEEVKLADNLKYAMGLQCLDKLEK